MASNRVAFSLVLNFRTGGGRKVQDARVCAIVRKLFLRLLSLSLSLRCILYYTRVSRATPGTRESRKSLHFLSIGYTGSRALRSPRAIRYEGEVDCRGSKSLIVLQYHYVTVSRHRGSSFSLLVSFPLGSSRLIRLSVSPDSRHGSGSFHERKCSGESRRAERIGLATK